MKRETMTDNFHARKKAIEFAEWMNINAVRSDEHEWRWKGDKYKAVYTTDILWDIFLQIKVK